MPDTFLMHRGRFLFSIIVTEPLSDQALESTDALKQAAMQAHQLELKKKLDEGKDI
jgi:hypothetical protein